MIYFKPDRPIFLFDGVCNLCNAAVDFIIKHENNNDIMFLSIQSELGQKVLSGYGKGNIILESSYVVFRNQLFEKASAVIFICKYLKKPWSYFAKFEIFPNAFLDFFYKIIAKNRYFLFGKKESCRIPTAQEKARFIT